mgnify:CR=1 FL=1
MKRKIAIIADGWRRHITYVWIRGCRNYIKEHELDIEISVFHSFGNFSRDEKFNAGEYNIIHLPDLSQFDGIILEVTNMLNQKKRQQIIRIIQESGVPAVSLLEKIPGLYHAGPDNYATMEQMVEHLIVAHSCKTLNYVGGPADSQENLLRWQAYEDVLQRYGIRLKMTESGMKAMKWRAVSVHSYIFRKNICCRMPLSAQMRILRWGSAIRHSRKDLKFRLIFV